MFASAPEFDPQRFWRDVTRFGAGWPSIFKQAAADAVTILVVRYQTEAGY